MNQPIDAAARVDAATVRARVSSLLWHTISVVDETGSTNADLAQQARAGAASGVVLISHSQTAGRGRFERRWETPAGAAIGLSVLLRPTQAMPSWGWLSLVAGMAVVQGLGDATEVSSDRLQLKWPNDVLIDGLKVCGILAERVDSPPHSPAAVVGIGLNLALTAEQLPVPTATSLILAGVDADPNELVAAILDRFAQGYQQWEAHGQVRDGYRDLCASLGKRLRVHESVAPGVAGGSVEGVGIDIDAQGRLVVRLDDGSIRSFWAGDVHHLR